MKLHKTWNDNLEKLDAKNKAQIEDLNKVNFILLFQKEVIKLREIKIQAVLKSINGYRQMNPMNYHQKMQD